MAATKYKVSGKYTYKNRKKGTIFAVCCNCKKEFSARDRAEKPKLRFCTTQCRIDYVAANAGKPNSECAHCKKPYRKAFSGSGPYCSIDCANNHKRAGAACVCIRCGVNFTAIQYLKTKSGRRISAVKGLRQHCSKECSAATVADKLRLIIGPMRPAWKGGTTVDHKKSYRGPGWNAIARKVRDRDGGKCVSCGMTNDQHIQWCGQQLEVHHKIPFNNFTDYKAANRTSNLETLCIPCHRKADSAVEWVQMRLA